MRSQVVELVPANQFVVVELREEIEKGQHLAVLTQLALEPHRDRVKVIRSRIDYWQLTVKLGGDLFGKVLRQGMITSILFNSLSQNLGGVEEVHTPLWDEPHPPHGYQERHKGITQGRPWRQPRRNLNQGNSVSVCFLCQFAAGCYCHQIGPGILCLVVGL